MFFTELKQRIENLERQNADLRYRMDEPWVQDAKEQYQKKTEDLYQEARKVILMGGCLYNYHAGAFTDYTTFECAYGENTVFIERTTSKGFPFAIEYRALLDGKPVIKAGILFELAEKVYSVTQEKEHVKKSSSTGAKATRQRSKRHS